MNFLTILVVGVIMPLIGLLILHGVVYHAVREALRDHECASMSTKDE